MQPPAQAFRASAEQQAVWQHLPEAPDVAHGFWSILELELYEAPTSAALAHRLAELVRREEILRTRLQLLPALGAVVQCIDEAGAARGSACPLDVRLEVARGRFARLQLRAPATHLDGPALRLIAVELLGGPTRSTVLQHADYAEWKHELLTESPASFAVEFWRDSGRAPKRATLGLQTRVSPFFGGARLSGTFQGVPRDLKGDPPFLRRAKRPEKRRPARSSVEKGRNSSQNRSSDAERGVFEPRELVFELDARRWAVLQRYAAASGCQPRHAALACYAALLSRLSATEELTVAYQDEQRAASVADAIGPYQLARPLQVSLARAGSLELLTHALECECEVTLAAHDGYDGRQSCAQHFAWLDGSDAQLGSFGVVRHERSVAAPFELRLVCRPHANGLALSFDYDAACFSEHAIACIREQWECAIDSLDADPGLAVASLELLGPLQRATMAPPAPPEWSERTTLELFERHVRATPQARAVVDGDGALSYAELDARADQLAHFLQQRGCARGEVVAILLPSCAQYVVAILAAHKLGAAYVPLDPEYPVERLRYMLADSGARCVVCTRAEAALCSDASVTALEVDSLAHEIAACPRGAPALEPLLDGPAYLIYTSGSSGQPKAVEISQRSLSWSTQARMAHYRSPVRAYLLLSSFAFDSSVAGIFWTLAQGGTLVLPRRGQQLEPSAVARLCARERISHGLSLPSLYEALLELPEFARSSQLQVWIVAGEACKPSVVRRHATLLPGVELSNEYGPTEGTVWATVARLDSSPNASAVSIGRAIPGMKLWLLNAAGKQAALGEAGEVLLGGPLLATGYRGRPQQTQEFFFTHPALGERIYRTSDRARFGGDGQLYFLGRLDRQVKLRGHRIELAEIEHQLLQHAGVRAAAVVPREHEAGLRLWAYVESSQPARLVEPQLRAQLRAALPAYMTPAEFIVLPELPRTPNGKLDVAALPAEPPKPVQAAFVAPRGELEVELAQLCQDLLRVSRVGAHADFFELGGDSITSLQLCARAAQRGIALKVRDVFDHRTVRQIAQVAQRQDLRSMRLDVEYRAPLAYTGAWQAAERAAEQLGLEIGAVCAAVLSMLLPARPRARFVLEHGFDVQGSAEVQTYQTLHTWPSGEGSFTQRLSAVKEAARKPIELTPTATADAFVVVDPACELTANESCCAPLRLRVVGRGPGLTTCWSADGAHYDAAQLAAYAAEFARALAGLLAHCHSLDGREPSAADFPDADLDPQSLDALLASLDAR